MSSRSPVGAEEFGLGENGFGGFFFQVWRVAVFSQDAFHHHFDSGTGAFADGPVDGDALADLVTNSAAMTLSSSLPIASTALSFAARAS